jgi:predicted acylesterase/phospholipase RssA
MRHPPQFAWSLRALLFVLLAACADTQAQQAAIAVQSGTQQAANLQCRERHVQVALGLPAEDQSLRASFENGTAVAGQAEYCGAIAWGSDYELLSWLENGGVQAAVLPAFIVDVMKADDPAKFQRDFLQFPATVLDGIQAQVRSLVLAEGEGQVVADPKGRLAQFYQQLLGSPAAGATIELPSHLSGAVQFLLQDAAGWVTRASLSGTDRDRFFGALVGAIRFSFSAPPCGAATSPAPTLQIVESVHPLNQSQKPRGFIRDFPADSMVVRRQVLLNAEGPVAKLVAKVPAPPSELVPDAALFADTLAHEQGMGPAVATFRDLNYRRYAVGQTSVRYFRFTLPEMWALLDSQRRDLDSVSQTKRLALVLTGGGVKAAYQTRMIDHLYGRKCLINAGMPPAPGAQQVDYVFGTSGGALLGAFVASMNSSFAAALATASADVTPTGTATAARPKTLTEILWRFPTPGIRSSDVFPLVDMLRYATLIVGILCLGFVAAITLAWFPDCYANVRSSMQRGAGVRVRRVRAFTEAWPWLLVLGIAPPIILRSAGSDSLEDVPKIAGVFYMLMAVIAAYSELALTMIAPFSFRRARVSWWAAAIAGAGIALIAAAYFAVPVIGGPPARVLLSCVGFLLLTLALHVFYWQQEQFFKCEHTGDFLRSVGVVVVLLLLSYLALAIVSALRITSFLELTGGFWAWFVPATLLFSIAVMVLGRARSAEPQQLSWLQRTVGFMFSEFASRGIWGSERRYMRAAKIATVAWLWWNVLAAPSLYGNSNAQGYFNAVFQEYATARREPGFSLRVPFIIAATSLEKSQERYFLLGDEQQLDRALNGEAWLHIASDPRWIVIREIQPDIVRDAAFASGSPFPVFSAHVVPVPALNLKERLIDGGFAHNTPLEAAATLGATKALVISSSPLEPGIPAAACRHASLLAIGDLTCNLPRLFPYLWSRSQVEDVLSTRNMFVAAIYPTASDGSWPMLTDFRAEVVQRLIKAADHDQQARIGVVESWGAPKVRKAIPLGYDVKALLSSLRAQAAATASPRP